MKKIFTILFLFISIICNAYVAIIEKQPEKDIKASTENCYVYRDTYTNEYFLVVMSSHQNNRNYFQVNIKLGNSADEAIESIKQIENIYETAKDGDEFIIDGHNCYVEKGIIIGKIQFPRREYESDFWDPIYYMRGYFGKLRIYKLAMNCYKNGEF